jgi:hypothetical protein
MRLGTVLAAALLVLGGSSAGSVQPTLADLRDLGYTCGDGVPDGVPSGTSQWICVGSVAGQDASVAVDGTDRAVTELTLDVTSADPQLAHSEFGRLVAGVAPLSSAPGIAASLASWSGAQTAATVRRARIVSECDSTQCIIDVTSVDGPLEPLILP